MHQNMASSFTIPTLQCQILQKSHFLGQNNMFNTLLKKPHLPNTTMPSTFCPVAKFDIFQIMGGRGLLKGEQGIEQELKRNVQDQENAESSSASAKGEAKTNNTTEAIQESSFGKELLGLTGGFPGGEKGLQNFIEKNPPPTKLADTDTDTDTDTIKPNNKPKAPKLPLLMPGMIAIVKNPNNPFYMYCGIIQRITDGRAGVLFEGGNWDRLATFRLEELERREKGPPMKNPRSCVLEPLIEKNKA